MATIALLLALLQLTALAAAAAGDPGGTANLVIASAKDLVVQGGQGGTSVTNAGCPAGSVSLRSGGQHSTSTATVVTALSPGITVTGVSFSYRYTTGYKGPVGANFSLSVGGTDVFASPPLTLFPYSKAGDFSPPTPADATKNLPIKVVPGTDKIAFNFQGNDRNVQLLLPMTITVHCTGGPCIAAPKLLPKFFDSNMVLQRGPAKAAVWGDSAAPGDEVTVSLSGGDDASAAAGPWTATAAADGSWAVAMDPQAAGSGKTLTVSTKSGRTQVLKNVAFGDVVLCSGQSNMGFSANLEFNASAEIADSVNYPGLRFWTSAQVSGSTPQTDLKNAQQGAPPALMGPYAASAWAVSAPAAFVAAGAADGKEPATCPGTYCFSWPSAICYFYGRDVYKGLGGKVPIGLVAADWGGQPIEPFMSADALADKTCGGTKPAAAPMPSQVAVASGGDDSNIWNGMIAPLAKMRFASIVWYQGESNYRAAGPYACSFPAMIHDWRTKFASPQLPFYFVQLAPCYGHKDCGDFVAVRNAQMAGLLLPNVSYATAVDLGDRSSPFVSVHPRRKQELCRRLSLQALKMQYGMRALVASGPEFASVAVAGSTITINYKAGTAGTLHSAETADSPGGCAVSPFEVSTTAGKWAQANFTIAGETVTIKLPNTAVIASTGVRYAWTTAPTCMLYNGAGAPGTGPNGTQPAATPGATGIAGTPFCWTGTAACPV